MKKYNIICVLANYKTSIVATFLHKKDALEALSACISKEFKNEEVNNYYKVYWDSSSEITINYCGYMGKSLYCKYFIIEYEDKTNETNETKNILLL